MGLLQLYTCMVRLRRLCKRRTRLCLHAAMTPAHLCTHTIHTATSCVLHALCMQALWARAAKEVNVTVVPSGSSCTECGPNTYTVVQEVPDKGEREISSLATRWPCMHTAALICPQLHVLRCSIKFQYAVRVQQSSSRYGQRPCFACAFAVR